ncbi:hypothetical protein BV25DRAFT_1901867 [Artomyces pyxidatus]|uniref:Uncharacterized protein n=1 Tax=Artomyces pyxidatus TaxID=48021 RepID=A0ACB8SS18_9AGAM|nr:hypothetical protein BV25DRAFT_1901867 [Artomyces pyxidatus]
METNAELPDLEKQAGEPSGSGSGSGSASDEKEKSVKVDIFETSPIPPVETPPLPSHVSSGETEDDDPPREYDERAAKLWSVYVGEAENHDKALIETWKDDMDNIIIFAGLYSASLTAFLVESYQNLQPSPATQSVVLMQQSLNVLITISQQLATNGSQVPAAQSANYPFPTFSPSLSNVRVNVFWFMSLVFSLTAALAATIVQAWVRDYMHVFQRYNHSLKRARIRQFLYEGAEGWYMNVIVDGIPALIHISLFLFFVGLSDFLFDINYTTAVTTTTLISICGALYLWSVIAPVLDAQSPYQSPLSGVFWLMFQIVRGRSHRDNSTGGKRRRVSTNMTDGRVQLAMDQSDERKKRDARAICWVIDNLTEDSELEPFVLGIPGSLNSPWGKEVWATVAKDQTPVPGSMESPQDGALERFIEGGAQHNEHRYDAIGDLSGRITRLLKTCTDPGILPTEDARRKRARACIDAALSLVLSMDNGDWEWFAEADIMAQALVYLGDVEKIREAPSTFDSIFAVRWSCMSLMAVRKMLQSPAVKAAAQRVIKKLAEVRAEKGKSDDEVAAKTTGIIDKYVKSAWDAADSLRTRLEVPTEADKMEERFTEISAVREQKVELAELEYSWNILGWATETDDAAIDLTQTIMHATGNVLAYLPGAVLQWAPDTRRTPDTGLRATPTWLMPQFVPARLLTQRLWLCAWELRSLAAFGWNSIYQPKKFSDFVAPELSVPELKKLMDESQAPFKTQLWRVLDLRDGGTIYMLELLVAAIRSNKLSSHSSSKDLYVGTFRSLTSDWSSLRNLPASQKALVALLHDIIPTTREKQPGRLPAFLIDEILVFAGNVLSGTKAPHVSEAVGLVRDYVTLLDGDHDDVAQKTLLRIAPPKRHKPLTSTRSMLDDDAPRLPRRNRKGDDPKVIGLWKIGRTIGKGSSGRVRIARHSKTGQYAAVKIVSKIALVNSRMSMQGLDEQAERILLGIEREIVIMKLIEHPNIMRLYDVWETSTELYLILEYVEGGELFDYLCTKGRLSTPEALGYFQQIISAIDYCHSFNIAHRDLKPENLLLDKDKNIKVADFGMAAWQMNNTNGLLQTACGSPHYAAPEVIEGRAYNGSSSDIWSCGVILFALLAGRLPFDDEDLHTLLEKVKLGSFVMASAIDVQAQDLIFRMLEKDVNKRITVPQILAHPFYTSQPPKKGAFVPPKLGEISRPLANKAAIDPDIFANLRTLWHGTADDEIVTKLTNKEQTWEKGVYHLLLRYRTKHLENYNAEQEDILRRASRNRKRVEESPARDRSEPPPRADPPTPRRASRRDASPSDTDPTPLMSNLLTPQYVYSGGSTSTPTSATPSYGFSSASPSPMSPNFPQTPTLPISPMSPLSPGSPIWGALNMAPPDVPEMQDEKVQQFFQQIVEHLNVMQLRSTAMGGSPNPMSPNVAMSPETKYFEGLPTEMWSTANRITWEENEIPPQHTGSERSTATKPLSIRRTLRRPAPLNLGSGNKENAAQEVELGGLDDELVARKSSLKSKGGARRAALADKRVQIVEPADGERGRLRRKKSVSSGPSTPTTADGSFPSPLLSPTWFGNLFKLKAASFSLLSVHDAHASREECRRLLTNIGVHVVLTQAEGMGTLKCRVDDLVDSAGVMGVAKAVRFRVEVHSATATQAVAGYATVLHLVQEKGALSSFKLVYNRLRRDWDLDAPKIPSLAPSPALTDGGRFADLLYG